MIAATACLGQWSGPPFPPVSVQLRQADLKEILGLLCPGHEYIGQESGCRVCPQGTAEAGRRADSTIESAIPGHFVDPKSEDLLVVLLGCSSHAGNFRDAFLFTRSASGWFVSQASGLPLGRCRKITNRAGRDGLLCFTDASLSDQSTGSLTFGYAGQKAVELVQALDNTAGACGRLLLVTQSAIQQVTLVRGTAGKLTVRILARCRRGPFSARARKACAAGPGFEDIGPALPFRTFRIDYLFDGEAMTLAPYSSVSKHAYDACLAAK